MSAMPAQVGAGRVVKDRLTTEADRAANARECSGREAWFPIDEAARLMGEHRATLNRRCIAEWQQQGSARRMPLAIGGRAVWHVHARISPRLVRASVEATPTGASAVHERLRHATQAQKEAAAAKARLVVAFRAWKSGPGIACVRDAYAGFAAAHPGAPSYTRMKEWSARCPSSDDLPGCMAALLDTRGRPREGAPSMSEAAWTLYCELYLGPRQWSHGKCWRAVRSEALERGWAWPSEDTVARTRDKRLTPSQIAMAREGEDAWARKFKAPIEQHPGAWAVNECWEGDNANLDFFVRVLAPAGDGSHKWAAARPVLTSFIDRRSRRLMGWSLGTRANATSIRRALISGIKVGGVPRHVWIDNGKDFASVALAGTSKAHRRASRLDREVRAEATSESALYLQLGITAHFAVAYNHNGKARLERWHDTLHRDHDREYASWCGSDEGDRPDPDTLKAALADVMALPTLDQARERLAEWIAWYNARDEHAIDDLVVSEADGSRRRLSPVEYHERMLPDRGAVDHESLALLWPTWSNLLTPTKRGVGVLIEGKVWHYGATHPAIHNLVGTGAKVYAAHDDDNLDEIMVYDESFRFLARAAMNPLSGGASVKREDLREAMAIRREQKRRAKARPSLVESVLTDAELVMRKARERQVAETNARLREAGHLSESQSVPMRLVTTPVDGQAARVAKARKAVGSEHDAMPAAMAGDEYGDILTGIVPEASERVHNGAIAGRLGIARPADADDEYDLSDLVRGDAPDDADDAGLALTLDMPEGDAGPDVLASLGDPR